MIGMIILLVIGLFLSCLSIYDSHKQEKLTKKIIYKDKMDSQSYKFLISEEGDKASYGVSSICNELGIILESDDEEEFEY